MLDVERNALGDGSVFCSFGYQKELPFHSRFGMTHFFPRQHVSLLLVKLADIHKLLALELVDLNAAGAAKLFRIVRPLPYCSDCIIHLPPSTGFPNHHRSPPLSGCRPCSSCSSVRPRRSLHQPHTRRRGHVCDHRISAAFWKRSKCLPGPLGLVSRVRESRT